MIVLRLVVCAALLLLTTVTSFSQSTYKRSDWPHWSAVGDCQSTRVVVLTRDSQTPIAWRDHSTKCEVAHGTWSDPYDGSVVNDPLKIDVDHVVPLQWAHEHGGASWTRERKRAYANDTLYVGHLASVSATLNRQKGARGPSQWAPPVESRRCAYAHRWAAILVMWDLRPGDDDREALRRMFATCTGVP